jgi:hypothetical protein
LEKLLREKSDTIASLQHHIALLQVSSFTSFFQLPSFHYYLIVLWGSVMQKQLAADAADKAGKADAKTVQLQEQVSIYLSIYLSIYRSIYLLPCIL